MNHVGGRSHSGGLTGPTNNTTGGASGAQSNNAIQNSSEGRRKISINYSTQLPNNTQVQNQNQILNSGNYGHNTHQIIISSQNNNQPPVAIGSRGQKFQQQHHRKSSQSSKQAQNQQRLGFQNGANNMIMNNYALETGAAPGQGQFNHSRGYSHEDANISGKFKKKNVRLIQDHNANALQNINYANTNSSIGQKGAN